MALDIKELGRYARLYLARKKLKEKYDALTKKLVPMEKALINHMLDQDEPVERISLKGGITIDIGTMIWAKVLTDDKQKLAEALTEAGLEHMLSSGVNAQSLSAYLRELDRENQPLPDILKDLIEPNPVDSLKVRKL